MRKNGDEKTKNKKISNDESKEMAIRIPKCSTEEIRLLEENHKWLKNKIETNVKKLHAELLRFLGRSDKKQSPEDIQKEIDDYLKCVQKNWFKKDPHYSKNEQKGPTENTTNYTEVAKKLIDSWAESWLKAMVSEDLSKDDRMDVWARNIASSVIFNYSLTRNNMRALKNLKESKLKYVIFSKIIRCTSFMRKFIDDYKSKGKIFEIRINLKEVKFQNPEEEEKMKNYDTDETEFRYPNRSGDKSLSSLEGRVSRKRRIISENKKTGEKRSKFDTEKLAMYGEEYTEERLIGRGSYGEVYLVRHNKSNTKFASK